MLKETEWMKNKTVPTMNEYISDAYISIAFGPIILIALYFLDLLPEKVVTSEEYKAFYIHSSKIGRLLNDRLTAKVCKFEFFITTLSTTVGCNKN